MENDIQYFKAVIDTANLISVWLKSNDNDIKKILSSLEINLEAKYGPFTSKLSNQIGINETLGLKNPDSYWKGVQDTLSLIKNFLNWKQISQSPRTVDNFLLEIVNKSNIRLEPDESPLITALGILFEQEFADNGKNLDAQPKNEPEPLITYEEKPSDSINTEIPEPLTNSDIDFKSEQKNEEEDPDKAFNPNEFIDDEKFLDQFIADSINPTQSAPEEDQTQVSEQDYLRSALEELSISSGEDSEEKVIDFQFGSTPKDQKNSETEAIDTPTIIEDAFDEKDTSRLLSSSLRDALRMLREED